MIVNANDSSNLSNSYNERVRRIQERLQTMQFDIESTSNAKVHEVEQQLGFVDDKVADWHHAD